MAQTSHQGSNGNGTSVKIDIPIRVINVILMGAIAFFVSPLNPIKEGIPTQRSNKIENDEVVQLLKDIKAGQDKLNSIFTKLTIPIDEEDIPVPTPKRQRRRTDSPPNWFRNRLGAKSNEFVASSTPLNNALKILPQGPTIREISK